MLRVPVPGVWKVRFLRLFGNTLAILAAIGSSGDRADCRWVLDAEGDRFERLVLANGYTKVHMHDEALNVLEGLLAEDLTRDERASVHDGLGIVHFRTKSLEKALFHFRQAVASGRLPKCQMPELWQVLAEVAFEMGSFEAAAQYAENWRAANEAVHPKYHNVLPLTPAELLRVAKYWSHVERDRALAYVDLALQDANHDVDDATRAWLQRLAHGDAPAEIPPIERPWLAKPPPSLSALEVMRKVEVLQERRRRITRPAEQPQALAREAWVTDWRRTTLDVIMLPPSAADVAPVVLEAPAIPEHARPASEAGAPDDGSARADRPNW